MPSDRSPRFKPKKKLAKQEPRRLHQNGVENSVDRYSTAIDLDPTNGWAYKNRANAYRSLGKAGLSNRDLTKAGELDDLNQWDDAIKSDPKNSVAYNRRGMVFSNRGDYTRAIRDYDTAISINPSFAAAYDHRALALARLKQYRWAIQGYELALELGSGNRGTKVRLENVYLETKREIDRRTESIGLNASDADAYSERGHLNAAISKYKRAIDDFDRALELNPKNQAAYGHRATVYKLVWEEIDKHSKAIDLDPRDARAFNNRGIAWANLRRYDRAIQDYEQSISLDSLDPVPYFNRAIAFKAKGQHREAAEDQQKTKILQKIKRADETIRLNSLDVAAYVGRGTAYGELRFYERAIRDFDKAISLDPTNPAPYFYRGEAHKAQGSPLLSASDYVKADGLRVIKKYDKQISMDARRSSAYRVRGNAYQTIREYKHAIKDFNKAIVLDPSDHLAYQHRAEAREALGEHHLANRDRSMASTIRNMLRRLGEAVSAGDSSAGWAILPPGWWRHPDHRRAVESQFRNRQEAHQFFDRLDYLESFKPTRLYRSQFDQRGSPYYAFVFSSCVVAENPLEGNALYVVRGLDAWQSLLKLSKRQLVQSYPERVRRIVHRWDWRRRLQQAIA